MCKKANSKRLKQLTDDILKLDIKYRHSPSADILKQRLLLKTEFDLLSTHQAENHILKSRHSSYEHGEKAGKILAHQLRQKISDDKDLKHTEHLETNSCFFLLLLLHLHLLTNREWVHIRWVLLQFWRSQNRSWASHGAGWYLRRRDHRGDWEDAKLQVYGAWWLSIRVF